MTEYDDAGSAADEAMPPQEELSKDARNMGMLCHLSALAGYFFPFGNIIGPLIVWLLKREESPFVDDQGKESLNFQITMSIAFMVSLMLVIVIIGFFLLGALAILNVVLVIIATIKANEGQYFRYPMTIRFIK